MICKYWEVYLKSFENIIHVKTKCRKHQGWEELKVLVFKGFFIIDTVFEKKMIGTDLKLFKKFEWKTD